MLEAVERLKERGRIWVKRKSGKWERGEILNFGYNNEQKVEVTIHCENTETGEKQTVTADSLDVFLWQYMAPRELQNPS